MQRVGIASGLSQPSNDRDNDRTGLGLRHYGESGLSGTIEWNTVLRRDHYDEDNINLLIGADF